MQDAKDTFYELLRTRLAARDPQRTIVVRGLTRPGILVDDNELPELADLSPALPDCFHLRWLEVAANPDGALAIVAQVCEIAYETAGTTANGGMDRGRLLAAMDAELCAAVDALPRNATKQNFAALARGGPAVDDGTRIWWSELTLTKTEDIAGRLRRTAKVSMMSLEKAGAQ